MMLDLEDIDTLEKRFDDRYVLKEECNDKQKQNATKFANDDKRIEIMSREFSTVKKLIWAIASASIGSLIAAIFELILK